MNQVIKVVGALVALATAHVVDAQMVSPPSITASGVQVFCQGLQPYVSFVLPVLSADLGRPGMVYVGMRDQVGTAAMFLQGGIWVPWDSGLFPVYSSVTSGLGSQQVTLPLNGNLAGGGWMLYAGYGVLTSDGEMRVQSYIATVQNTERITNKKVSSVDPDHYRRTLVQDDMSRYGKYTYISTGVENNGRVCQPDNEVN